jgi:hypothetical protein
MTSAWGDVHPPPHRFGIGGRDKWVSLGWACCSFPALLLLTYLAVKFIRHAKV